MMNVKEIMTHLPHRFPFLLLDRVLEIGEQHIVAQKNVTIDEPFFQGHFPDMPILPGVLQVEIMAQASGLLAIKSFGDVNKSEKEVFLMAIDNARFRRPVTPGDVMIIRVELLNKKGGVFKFKGVITVDNVEVTSAEFMAMMRDKR
jgi:beta-hydroxyacyl-ACP dehydratase FabZ